MVLNKNQAELMVSIPHRLPCTFSFQKIKLTSHEDPVLELSLRAAVPEVVTYIWHGLQFVWPSKVEQKR